MQGKERVQVPFDKETTQEMKQLTTYRNKFVESIMKKTQQSKLQSHFSSFLSINRPFPELDDPKNFFIDESFTSNINSIPSIGNCTITGWTSSYWPMRNGEVSVRYPLSVKNTVGIVDPETGDFSYFYTWAESVALYSQPQEHLTYSNTTTYAKYIDDNYSPSEKYDLLLGDHNFTMTNYLKNTGFSHNYGGDIPLWFGLCHGWAPASTFFPKPSHSVMLTSPEGLPIRFLPDDIKGLASLFWGNAQFTTRFAGKVCEYYWPDPNWFTSPACLSINPASFMIILGNQIGLHGKNIIFDPDADAEIWNQPLKSYEFRFYNPLTIDFSSSPSTAKVSLSSLRSSNDEFLHSIAMNAGSKAVSAVGVFMKITYVKGIDNSKLKHDDSTTEDLDQTDEFDAIVELDEHENMLGGEWKFKTHPNFIWWYDESKPVEGVSDKDIPVFSNDKSYLDSVSEKIVESSSKGQPLYSVVNLLVENSI